MYKECGIYCYHNIINGKNYIGQSVNLKARKKNFGKNYRYSGILFYNAVKKYGVDNFQYSTLTHCKPEELNYYEAFYIGRLKSNDRRYGYNCTSGGDSRYSQTEDTKERMRKSWTEERRKKQSFNFSGKKNPNFGRKHSDEERKKISEEKNNLNKIKFFNDYGMTEDEMIIKIKDYISSHENVIYKDISNALNLSVLYTRRLCYKLGYGKDQVKEANAKRMRMSVVQCDRKDNSIILNIFSSLHEAMHITGITTIKNCLKGKAHSSGGYFWRYATENEIAFEQYNEQYLSPTDDRLKLTDEIKQELKEKGLHGFHKKEKLYKKVFCYNKDCELVKIYESVTSCEEDGFKRTAVQECCTSKKGQKTYKGLTFSYAELSKEEITERFVETRRKPILQLSKDGILIKEWESITQAANYFNISPGNISACCLHKVKTCNGSKWEFK